LRGAQTEVIDSLTVESTFAGQTCVEAQRTQPHSRLHGAPRRECLLVKPYRQAALIAQGAIILGPMTNAIPADEGGFAYAPMVTIGVTFGVTVVNCATTPFGDTADTETLLHA
jgi:hypothetical protein